MWKKIRDSFIFFALALVVFIYGAWHVVTLIFVPHIARFASKVGGK